MRRRVEDQCECGPIVFGVKYLISAGFFIDEAQRWPRTLRGLESAGNFCLVPSYRLAGGSGHRNQVGRSRPTVAKVMDNPV